MLTALLYEFPVRELQFYLPAWVSALPADHPLKTALYAALRERTANVSKLREAEPALETLRQLDTVEEFRLLGAFLIAIRESWKLTGIRKRFLSRYIVFIRG